MKMLAVCIAVAATGIALIGCSKTPTVINIVNENTVQRSEEIPCLIPAVAVMDNDGYWYGYHDCWTDNTGKIVYSIEYINGPYQGMIFQLFNDDRDTNPQKNKYILIDGKRFYLH